MNKARGRPTGLLLSLLLAGLLCLQALPAQAQAQAQSQTGAGPAAPPAAEFEDGSVLVGYQPGTGEQDKRRIESLAGARRHGVVGVETHVLKVPPGQVLEIIEKLKKNPQVRYAEPNYIARTGQVPNDYFYYYEPYLWGLKNTGQTVQGVTGQAGADIEAEPAWNFTTGSKNIVVGVVDTGIFYNHPDLAANVWTSDRAIPKDASGATCEAGSFGYNAITNTCDPWDDNSHGTHVAGTIGAVGNNDLAVTGVNWNVSLMGLRAFNSGGTTTTATAVAAINYAINAKQAGVNVRVLNNSWFQGASSTALYDVILKAGANDILFVTIAGNNNTLFGGQNIDAYPVYPGGYGNSALYPALTNVITVAATDQKDNLPGWSNYGAKSVHLGAPGVNILSTYYSDNAAYLSGTSMAAPHVSGAAALLLSAPNASYTAAGLRNALLSNVDPLPSLAGKTSTGGRLNVCRAIPGCSPDFRLSVSPASQSLLRGEAATYSVSLNWLNGLQDPVTLAVSGLPAGATSTFTPNPLSPDPATASAASTLTVQTSGATPAGAYTLTVTGQSGAIKRTATATLTVNSPPDFSLSASPTSRTVIRGSSTYYDIKVTPVGGFSQGVTLSVSGLPSGVTASFNPATTPAGTAQSASRLTLATRSTTPAGTYTLTVKGVAGGLTRTTTVTLVVKKS